MEFPCGHEESSRLFWMYFICILCIFKKLKSMGTLADVVVFKAPKVHRLISCFHSSSSRHAFITWAFSFSTFVTSSQMCSCGCIQTPHKLTHEYINMYECLCVCVGGCVENCSAVTFLGQTFIYKSMIIRNCVARFQNKWPSLLQHSIVSESVKVTFKFNWTIRIIIRFELITN